MEPVKLNEAHASWMRARGLDPDIAERLGMSSDGAWLVIQCDDGRQLRNTSTREMRAYGAPGLFNSRCLTGDHVARDSLLIVECPLDAVAVIMAGYDSVIAIPHLRARQEIEARASDIGRFRYVFTYFRDDRLGALLHDQVCVAAKREVKSILGCPTETFARGGVAAVTRDIDSVVTLAILTDGRP